MLIRKLLLRNIRSYENLEIEFPKGAVLLSGDIGCGKTSILLGLQFALFGLQPGQKGASLLKQGTDSAYASVEIDIDGEVFKIERTMKKAKNGSIAQDANVLYTGNSAEELSTSEMKDRVLKILNYPKEFAKKSNLLYKYTVYTPQEEMKSIIEEKPEVRLDTLRHIFGIDRYKRIKENSQLLLQKIKEAVKIKEVLAAELNLLKEKLNMENEKRISIAREVNNLNIEYQALVKERNKAEEKVGLCQLKIEEKKEIDLKISNLEILIQGKKDFENRIKKELILMQKQTNEEIDFSEEKLRNVTDLAGKHKRNLDEKNLIFLKVNSQISVLRSRKEEPEILREKISHLENCPTCFQTVGNDHKEKMKKKWGFDIEAVNRELEQKMIEKERLKKEIEKEKELSDGYEKDKNIFSQNKIKFEHQLIIKTKIKSDSFILDRTCNEIEQVKKQLKEEKTRLNDYLVIIETYNNSMKEFRQVDEIARKKEILIATKNKESDILKKKIEELESEIKTKEKIREQINYLRSLENWINEKFLEMIVMTEKNVMAKLRSEFSGVFNEWFSMLAPATLSVRLDEEFTPVITNQDYEIDYEFLSGGERTAVALAYRLALNQVLNSFLSRIKTKDLVILDEPTDGFATEQLDKMRDIFEQLNMGQIILVSHEQKIEGFVDHVIRIKKEGVSRIER
ncbi:MAG: AAA family ATPase [Nanoarchaeota archaeon]|nr:AAA family ATPase [Nanoarchaeota archaeon]